MAVDVQSRFPDNGGDDDAISVWVCLGSCCGLFGLLSRNSKLQPCAKDSVRLDSSELQQLCAQTEQLRVRCGPEASGARQAAWNTAALVQEATRRQHSASRQEEAEEGSVAHVREHCIDVRPELGYEPDVRTGYGRGAQLTWTWSASGPAWRGCRFQSSTEKRRGRRRVLAWHAVS